MKSFLSQIKTKYGKKTSIWNSISSKYSDSLYETNLLATQTHICKDTIQLIKLPLQLSGYARVIQFLNSSANTSKSKTLQIKVLKKVTFLIKRPAHPFVQVTRAFCLTSIAQTWCIVYLEVRTLLELVCMETQVGLKSSL